MYLPVMQHICTYCGCRSGRGGDAATVDLALVWLNDESARSEQIYFEGDERLKFHVGMSSKKLDIDRIVIETA